MSLSVKRHLAEVGSDCHETSEDLEHSGGFRPAPECDDAPQWIAWIICEASKCVAKSESVLADLHGFGENL